jgi:hypothetical protein
MGKVCVVGPLPRADPSDTVAAATDDRGRAD